MDSHLAVDAGALDAGQDPQVGGQPLRIYRHRQYETRSSTVYLVAAVVSGITSGWTDAARTLLEIG